jgi:hypothetical protein
MPWVCGPILFLTHKSFAQWRRVRYNAHSIDKEVARLMDGIAWAYIISAFVIVGFAAWLFGVRWARFTANPDPVHCPSCETPMSARPIFKSPIGFNEWMCPHCGTRMDKRGRNLSETA